MAYLLIEDFKNGMDRSRPMAVGAPGSLWLAENCVVSRGGDVQKAKKFVPVYDLPEGTFGAALVDNQIEVYASSAASPPAGVRVQVLTAPNTPAMTNVLHVSTPGGKAYVIAKFDDGSIYHYYDGARITDLDALADGNASFESVAAYLAEEIDIDADVRVDAAGDEVYFQAITPGEAFTLSASAVNGAGTDDQAATVTTLQANVVEVANVDSYATVELTGGTSDVDDDNRVDQIAAGATNLMAAAVPVGTSLSATALQVAAQINNGTTTHGFSAVATDETVAIYAAVNTGADENGKVVTVTTAGDVTVSKADFANGVDYVAPVAQRAKVSLAGTFDADDTFTITLNGVEHKVTGRGSAYGTFSFNYKNRVYLAAHNVVQYSKLGDSTDFTDSAASSGAGILAVSSDSGLDRAAAIAEYNDRVAVFGDNGISVYVLSTDAEATELVQSLANTGTEAPRSVAAYGNLDVFYLDHTGVRSLRARDSSNAAFVSDVGNIIDGYIADRRAAIPLGQVRRAQATVEPTDGRYMLSLGDEIITLSRFPGSKISAWTVLKPGFTPGTFIRSGRDLFVRAGDVIYSYGGFAGEDYVDADECVVLTPFMSAGSPAAHKQLTGLDVACKGSWTIELLTDPNDESQSVVVARIRENTMNHLHIALDVRTAVFAIRATCTSAGAASLSQLAVHYKGKEAK